MAAKIFTLADSLEASKRNELLEKFINSVFDERGRPYFVPDKASLYDITSGNELKVINRINRTYGVSIKEEHFHWPICELLDFISSKEKTTSINR
jgi:hypothetical protein